LALDWALDGKVPARIGFTKLHAYKVSKANKADDPAYVEVFSIFITIKGKKVYRKDGKVWHFYAKRR
jgi:hypothetical protein